MPEFLTDRYRCHKCDKTGQEKLSKCGRCEAITYCSRKCQAEDWLRHKDNCDPVMVAEVGKKGLVAARNIHIGEQILIDSVVISMERMPFEITRKIARSFRRQIKALPEEKATEFNNLSLNDGITFGDRDLKILRRENCLADMKTFLSNRIQTQEEDLLLFALSLINHSCLPNVEECPLPRESEDQEKVEEYELRAVRDISKGEEITISRSIITCVPKLVRLDIKEQFGLDCKCRICCSDIDEQDEIIQKIISLTPDLILDSKKKYNIDEWRRMATVGALMVAMYQKLHIASVKMKVLICSAAAQVAQLARDPVLLESAMEALKELVMKTGFEKLKVEYDERMDNVMKWAPQFDSKKPPTKEEIDVFWPS